MHKLRYDGHAFSMDLGLFKLYGFWLTDGRNRYLYVQVYAGYRRRKTFYVGKLEDVKGIAGRLVAATAALGKALSWGEAAKRARELVEKAAGAIGEAIERLASVKSERDLRRLAEEVYSALDMARVWLSSALRALAALGPPAA